MSTNKIPVFEIKGKSVKKMLLTPDKFREVITTEPKRKRFKAGRLVRVRSGGELHKYFGPDNRRAAGKAA